MSVQASVNRMLQRYGETMALRRVGCPDLPVKAKRYGASADAIAGSMDDAALSIKIGNRELAAADDTRAPRKGDFIGPFAILACDTRKEGETVVMHILAVGGGG